jgi:hypothetical protein
VVNQLLPNDRLRMDLHLHLVYGSI